MNYIIKIANIIFLLSLALNLAAQSDNYTSAKVEQSIIVNKSTAQVWDLVSNVNNFSLLVPQVIQKVETSGHGVYTSWVLHLANGSLIKEEMTYFNTEDREFSYVMTKTPMPLSDYLAIQQVEEVNDNQSKVTFTTYYNANAQNQENLRTTFIGFQRTFLNNIEKNLP